MIENYKQIFGPLVLGGFVTALSMAIMFKVCQEPPPPPKAEICLSNLTKIVNAYGLTEIRRIQPPGGDDGGSYSVF
jgi:hypothetical protein